MGDENAMRDFLEKEVPDWKDDDFARGRFKAFSGQKQDWGERMNFWTDLIIKVARHLDLVVIDTQVVSQFCPVSAPTLLPITSFVNTHPF